MRSRSRRDHAFPCIPSSAGSPFDAAQPACVCDNPFFGMRSFFSALLWITAFLLAGPSLQAQEPPAPPPPPPPLVLAGGTVIDLTDWGHSAKDLHDAIVILDGGKISAVGSRTDRSHSSQRAHHRLLRKIPDPRPRRRLRRHEQPGPGECLPLHGCHHRGGKRRRAPRPHRHRGQSQTASLSARLHRHHRRLEPAHRPARLDREAARGHASG